MLFEVYEVENSEDSVFNIPIFIQKLMGRILTI